MHFFRALILMSGRRKVMLNITKMKNMSILSHLSSLTGRNRSLLLVFSLFFILPRSFSQNVSASITRDSLYKAIRSLAKNDSTYIHKSDSAKKLTNELVARINKVSEDLKQTTKQNSN